MEKGTGGVEGTLRHFSSLQKSISMNNFKHTQKQNKKHRMMF